MKIYINSNYEIKAINSTTDETLTEIEIDRELVFSNMSDFMILNYCYKPSNYGYSVYPAKDYNTLVLMDEQNNKLISALETIDELYTVLEANLNEQQILSLDNNNRIEEMYKLMEEMGIKDRE